MKFSHLFSHLFLASSVSVAFGFLPQIGLASESAMVLPEGRFRVRAVGVFTGPVSQSFNSEGELELLSHSMNRSVTLEDIRSQNSSLDQLASAVGSFDPGLENELLNTNLEMNGSLSIRSYLMAVEYGVTKDITIGIRAPIVYRGATASFDAQSVNNAEYVAQKIGGVIQDSAVDDGLKQLANQKFDKAFFEKAVFSSKGYDVPSDFEKTEIGDAEFGMKWNFLKNSKWSLSALWGGRAPTGSTASLTNLLDQGSGNGAWATALQLFQDYEVASWVTVGSAQKITAHFQDTRERAVPLDEADSLPSLLPENGQVENVTRKQSPKLETELSGTFYPFGSRTISFWSAYQYRYKSNDEFTGPTPGKRYDLLSEGTEYVTHYGEIGVGYSSIPAFIAKKMAVPFEIKALFNTPLRGKNSTLVSYGRLDLIVYF